jgi:hypothetical protein
MNGVALASSMDAALRRLNLPPLGNSTIAVFTLLGFAVGMATVWLYAAIRPRFGAGVATATYAALIVWFLAYVYPSVGMQMMGMFPADLTIIALLWGAAELVLASVAGAWLYHESPAGAAVRT